MLIRKSAAEHLHSSVYWAKRAMHLSYAGVWALRGGMAASVGALAFAIHAPSSNWAYLTLLWSGVVLSLGGRWLIRSPARKWHVISRFHYYAALGDDPCAGGCVMCAEYGVPTLPQYVIDDRVWILEREQRSFGSER